MSENQVQLDTAATVAEVLQSARAVRIRARIPLHYLAADRAGNVAVIEFLDGKLHSAAANLDPIQCSFRKTPFLAQASEARMEVLAGQPDGARCASTGSGPR